MFSSRRLGLIWLAWLLPAAMAAAQSAPEVRHQVVLPAKPDSALTLHVCRNGEQPDCMPSIAAALVAAPRDNVRVVVHCGIYRGDTVDLGGFRNLVLEGKPCDSGRLPVLDADGRSTLQLGAYPWMGAESSHNLWVEHLELRNNHVAGNGAPVIVGGSGDVVFRNVYVNENDNGILISGAFDGTVYVVDSVFRNNGYGKFGRTHHISAVCQTECLLIVLDSYFGKVLQGGSHVHFAGNLYAIGNIFIDEPGGVSRRVIDTTRTACRVGSAADEPPCLIAENYMLKNHTAYGSEFITLGEPRVGDTEPKAMLVRNNAALALRDGAILVGNKQPNSKLILRGNLMVVKDPPRCSSTGIDCLLTIPEFGATLDGNRVSGDPTELPALFDGRAGRR